MEYDPKWSDMMLLIWTGRKSGDSVEKIRDLAEINPDNSELFEMLLEEHRKDPKTFEETSNRFRAEEIREYERLEAEAKAALALARKPLEERYLTLRRTAFTIPKKRWFGGRAHLRIHHNTSWMRSLHNLLPTCAEGHPMTLTVILTTSEVDQCLGARQESSGGIFCSCTQPDCLGEDQSWQLLFDPSIYNQILAASGCRPQTLQVFTDSPCSNEGELVELLNITAPQMDPDQIYHAREAFAQRYHHFGKTKIGGFGSYANPRLCRQCEGTKHYALLTLAMSDLGIREEYAEDAHLQVTICQTCGRPDCRLECT